MTDDRRTAEDVSTEELQRRLRIAHQDEDEVDRVSLERIMESAESQTDDEQEESEDDRVEYIRRAIDGEPEWLSEE